MGSTRCVTYQGCHEGVEVEFCTVTGMGHCWPEDSNCGPGGGPTYGVTDFKASPMMWEFFRSAVRRLPVNHFRATELH